MDDEVVEVTHGDMITVTGCFKLAAICPFESLSAAKILSALFHISKNKTLSRRNVLF